MSEHAELSTEKAAQPRQPASWRQQLQRLIDVALTAAISAALTFLFLLMAALVFSMKESGSAADWLATLFNGVVAFAAVAAFFVARSWLPQLTTQEGYKTAIQLVNEQYIHLGEDHPPAVATNKAIIEFNKSNEAGLRKNLEKYDNAMRELEIELQAARQNWEKIKNFRFCLDTYGLTEAPHYKVDLDEMLKAFETSLPLGEALLTSLKSDLSRRKIANDKVQLVSDQIWRERLATDGEMLKANYEKYKAAISVIRVAHAKIFNDNPAIGKLFKVRR